jgi:hypothetical protein
MEGESRAGHPHWCLEMLIASLQLMAADVDDQIAALPWFVSVADEVAITFGEAYILRGWIEDAELIDPGLVPKLDAIEKQTVAMSGQAHPEFWTDEALRTFPEWQQLRVQAREILADLGIELAPPNLSTITYVGPDPPPRPTTQDL